MKVLILAAGSGTRLKDLTKINPKCLVEVNNKPLLEYQLEILKKNKLSNIYLVGGYQYKKIKYPNIKLFINKSYASTNMVYTLFCAKEIFEDNEDVLVTYGDILYQNNIIQKLINSKEEISLTIDLDWKSYWEKRMDNPLLDAETLKHDLNFNIKELGKKPKSYSEINGQYMGLIKIRADIAKNIFQIWDEMDRKKIYDGKNYNNMYMTTFLQHLIDIGITVKGLPVHGGWAEIDTPLDIRVAEEMISTKQLNFT
tara:strand:+ start:6244 stop:7008 length:765 start_codon:yes stop_codon:yes gene_type:complete